MKEANVVLMRFGSHLYGLNTPTSDIDIKGIYLPTKRELLLGNYAQSYKSSTGGDHEKNKPGDIDHEVIALPTFVKFACDGETFAIDMLHCQEPIVSSPIWYYLVNNRTKFYSRNLKAFVGYVKKQAAKYGVKGTRSAVIKQVIDIIEPVTNGMGQRVLGDYLDNLPITEYSQIKKSNHPSTGEQTFYELNGKMYQSSLKLEMFLQQIKGMYDSYGHRAKLAEQNEGVDWKAVSHALRVAYQARDIYKYGDFQYPLKETQFLLDVKQGKLDYKTEVAPVLEALVEEVDELAEKAIWLPEKVDRNFWDNWLVEIYEEFVL